MEKTDYSKKTILVLVVLTVVISSLGVLLVSYEASKSPITTTSSSQPSATGQLSLTVEAPPQPAIAELQLVVLPQES